MARRTDLARVKADTPAVYERQASTWDSQRPRTLFERPWLDRLLARVPRGASILDLGCGTGEPIARYLAEQGRIVCGVDQSAAMLAIARQRLPTLRWIEADMRSLDLGERFDGIVAWDSFFHLDRAEQRAVLPRLAAHLHPGGALLVTVGPDDGEVTGHVGGEEVYHASLAPTAYRACLAEVGLEVEAFVPEDPDCNDHSVLLAVARRERTAR